MKFLEKVFGEKVYRDDIELIIDILDIRINDKRPSNYFIAGILSGGDTAAFKHSKHKKMFGKYRDKIRFYPESKIICTIEKLLGTPQEFYQDGLIKKENPFNCEFSFYNNNKIKIWKTYFEKTKEKYETRYDESVRKYGFLYPKNLYKDTKSISDCYQMNDYQVIDELNKFAENLSKYYKSDYDCEEFINNIEVYKKFIKGFGK